MTRRIVSHTLSSLPDTSPDDAAAGVGLDGLDGLELRAYSLMKHGHVPSINALADRLCADLLAAEPRLLDPAQRISLPVAYLAVLPACGHLAARIAEGLRAARPADAAPVRAVRIAKSAVTTIDYASSTAQQRREQMDSLRFSLDTPVDGDLVVLVDDVRITGLAEEAAVRALADSSHPAEVITAYVAAATPELAADPAVERALNHAVVQHPADLLPAMDAGEFALTIRYLKWALSTEPVAELLERVPAPILGSMLEGATASGLLGRPEYARAGAWFAAHSPASPASSSAEPPAASGA